ncbi:C40 family peptidase [Cohnella thailandensis]|uniref:C40 family peptidase n=1 Tax=Cohnella thailandensis TaxID=557557 RepID=UPI001E073CFA|nr:cell wall-associated NlpC family hydrolase [Cohnella thailandensis]
MIALKKLLAASAIALSLLTAVSTVAVPAPSASAAEIYATNGHKFVNTAKSYIGRVTYRFGVNDTSRLIMDCSAFTKLVFKKNGINLPWGSKAQAKFGTRVGSKSNLAIGDLVMFSVGTPGVINHVGIYIGNGQFISNTKSGGVSINSIWTGYWGSRFIMGRHY